MSLESLYGYLNILIVVGWVLLIFAPRWNVTRVLVRTGLYPSLFAIVYLVLAIVYYNPAEVDFSSLEGLMQGFTSPGLVVMGWAHYLVFDLFVAIWVVSDSEKLGLKHFWLIPILVLCLMAGPIGFLVYWLVRLGRKKKFEEVS